MKPSRVYGLSLTVVFVALTAVAAHQARAATAPGAALDYFAGSWFCHTNGTMPDGTSFSTSGDLTFHPWAAWYIATWEGDSGAKRSAAPLPWTPAISNTALMLFGYDPVGENYVAFKFLPSGPFAQVASDGPTDGTWEWSGALSNDGNNKALSVRATIDASNPNTYTSLNQVSTDLGQTWMSLAAGQCFRL